tara:strand:- start:6370 stop:6645 length:276 start_codon:yes stop_codon:yes gene_type:complete
MTIFELMERSNMNNTGRAIAYIKDALREMNLDYETHIRNENIDITKDQRNYTIPNEMVKVLDIRVKNHLNSKDEYRSIPRLLYSPEIKDND